MAKSYFMLCQHDMQEQCMPYYLMYYLRYFCWLAHSGVQHILSCFLLCFFSVLCTLCSSFSGLSIILLPLRYSLTFILLKVICKAMYHNKELCMRWLMPSFTVFQLYCGGQF